MKLDGTMITKSNPSAYPIKGISKGTAMGILILIIGGLIATLVVQSL